MEFKKFELPWDGQVIGAVQFPHPTDAHLWLVMTKSGEAFAFWTYNTETGDTCHGSYFPGGNEHENRTQAYAAFQAKVAGLIKLYEGA